MRLGWHVRAQVILALSCIRRKALQMNVRIRNSRAAFVSDPRASGLTFPACLCFCHLQADRAVRGASRPAAAVGAAPAAVRAVHGPAALLPRHRAGGQLDEQTRGNVQAETSPPREQQSLFRLLFGWLTWATKSLPFQSQSNEGGGTEPASVTCAFVSPCCSSGQTLRKGPGFSDEGDGVKLITEIVFFKP